MTLDRHHGTTWTKAPVSLSNSHGGVVSQAPRRIMTSSPRTAWPDEWAVLSVLSDGAGHPMREIADITNGKLEVLLATQDTVNAIIDGGATLGAAN